MACGQYPDHPINYLLDWDFADAVVCTFGDQITVAVAMLMFFGITFLILYLVSDSVMVPVAVMIVLAPTVSSLLPAIGLQFTVVVTATMLAVAGMYGYISVKS